VGLMILTLAVLEVTITCSICYDTADNPSILSTHTTHRSLQSLYMITYRSLDTSSAEYRLFYRSLLQKRPIILSILLTKATPYTRQRRLARAHVLVSRTPHTGLFCSSYDYIEVSSVAI